MNLDIEFDVVIRAVQKFGSEANRILWRRKTLRSTADMNSVQMLGSHHLASLRELEVSLNERIDNYKRRIGVLQIRERQATDTLKTRIESSSPDFSSFTRFELFLESDHRSSYSNHIPKVTNSDRLSRSAIISSNAAVKDKIRDLIGSIRSRKRSLENDKSLIARYKVEMTQQRAAIESDYKEKMRIVRSLSDDLESIDRLYLEVDDTESLFEDARTRIENYRIERKQIERQKVTVRRDRNKLKQDKEKIRDHSEQVVRKMADVDAKGEITKKRRKELQTRTAELDRREIEVCRIENNVSDIDRQLIERGIDFDSTLFNSQLELDAMELVASGRALFLARRPVSLEEEIALAIQSA